MSLFWFWLVEGEIFARGVEQDKGATSFQET